MTTLVIAKTTFGEAVRKKILNIFLLVALAMIAFSFSFASFSMREELTIIKSFGLGVIAIAGLFISIVIGINLVPAEVDRRTIYTILSKPVRRHEFLLGKFLGALLTIAVNLALMSVVFLAMIAWKNNWNPEWALLKGIIMIFFQLFLLSSITLLFSVFTTPVLNFFLTSGIYIIGSMSDITMSLSQGENRSVVVKAFYWVIHTFVPQFGNFFTQNPLIHPEAAVQNETIYYAKAITYAIVYAAVMMVIAILAFERRDM